MTWHVHISVHADPSQSQIKEILTHMRKLNGHTAPADKGTSFEFDSEAQADEFHKRASWTLNANGKIPGGWDTSNCIDQPAEEGKK